MPADDTSIRDPNGLLAEDRAASEVTNIARLAPSSGAEPLPSGTMTPTGIAPEDKTVISKRAPLPPDATRPLSAPQALGAALVGRRLEHYELNEFVGGGGMGAVFRATDTRLGRTVAVKVLSRDRTDEEMIRRFKNEAQSAARLDHPNIARVYYVGEDAGWNFIVFEFIEGTNLRDRVEKDGPLDLEQALHYTLQIAEALAHSSGREVVHRDIKPSNVLVMASDQVKLVDMGLARLHQVESEADDLTASGVTLGTFDYISPEQARDPRAADVRSDIYSLGCTLFYMLTGQPPFPEGTALQKLLKHNSDEPPDVRSFRPELHPRVSALLLKMLSKAPTRRQQSSEELVADIILLGQQIGLPSIADYSHRGALTFARVGQWQSKAWQALGAVALLIALMAAADVLLSPRQAGGDVVMRMRFKPSSPTAAAAAESSSSPSQAANTEAQPEITTLPIPSSSADTTGTNEARAAPLPASSASSDSPPSASLARDSSSAALLPSDERITKPDLTESPDISLTRPASPMRWEASKPKRIVVLGDAPAPPEPQTEYVMSLAEAAAMASELGLNEVELQFTGQRIEQPLELSNQRLTVRAAAEHRPLLVFRPAVRAGEHRMIRLAGGGSAHLSFERVDLRLELPADAPADGWSLIAMSTGQSLDLTDCVVTVQDGDGQRLPIHEQVAMISVQRRRPGETMTMADPQVAMGQPAKVILERCIARGEASLLVLTEETPLTFRWNQGLLNTSKHLIETGGTGAEPQYYEQIVLDLDNVTAVCKQGMYYLRRGVGKAYQFHVNSMADNCVFLTDPGASLFEMIGLSAPPETDELQSTGEGNRFSPLDMPFLIVRPVPGSEGQVFRLGRRWSTETRPQAGVPWIHPPPLDRPAHELTKNDFQIEGDGSGGSTGFDALLLPEILPVGAGGAIPATTVTP